MSAGFAALMRQAALMSEKATVRTAGIVGDDLAINSKQLIGGQPDRKLPMVWAVAKGSAKNKAILIPCALALSLTLPGLIMPALTLGGAYLCYEGIDKFLHQKPKPAEGAPEVKARDHAAWEKRHVKKAIKTDLILSAEIVAVSLWTVAAAPFAAQAIAMIAAGIAMTAGVYGVVGGIIKLDDVGAWLAKREGKGPFAKTTRALGKVLQKAAPPVIKTIGVIGTVAMFLVGGGMVLNGIPAGAHLMAHMLGAAGSNPLIQTAIAGAIETAAGVAAGFAAIPFMKVIEPAVEKAWNFGKKIVNKIKPKPAANDDDDEAPAPTPVQTASPALSSVPDAKAGMNAAAKPASNDNPAAVDQKPAAIKPPAP